MRERAKGAREGARARVASQPASDATLLWSGLVWGGQSARSGQQIGEGGRLGVGSDAQLACPKALFKACVGAEMATLKLGLGATKRACRAAGLRR